jgi:hypothetical protein
MKQDQTIPFYAPDGRSLGFRTLEAAKRLVAGGYVRASYGRRKEVRALWLLKDDGSNPVETHVQAGTRYSFREALDSGLHCWKFRPLANRDRACFLRPVLDCVRQ